MNLYLNITPTISLVKYSLPFHLYNRRFKRNAKTNNLLTIHDRTTGQCRYISCPLQLDVGLISKVANSIARCIQRNSQKLSGSQKS